MKIYYVNIETFGYDQYDGFVVVAKSSEMAIDFLQEKYSSDWGDVDWKSGYMVTEIKPGNYKESTIILGSYNAG